ncbi:hypothetical protein CHS0354_042861 [Potamilus streckersoni]|uniref:Uncharacterized protein n=1 Tax=Potamilus streckersoni TaxID=2493646 RepID=A0AAE0W6F2_9BIVA|nr:hypothetical protein CHS0354_042861 [Potamilus streckersoni]
MSGVEGRDRRRGVFGEELWVLVREWEQIGRFREHDHLEASQRSVHVAQTYNSRHIDESYRSSTNSDPRDPCDNTRDSTYGRQSRADRATHRRDSHSVTSEVLDQQHTLHSVYTCGGGVTTPDNNCEICDIDLVRFLCSSDTGARARESLSRERKEESQ